MASVKIVLNSPGVAALLKSPAVRADIDRRVRAIAAVAGPGMEPSTQVGRARARGSVITTTRDARRAEAESRALTRALDAGRR